MNKKLPPGVAEINQFYSEVNKLFEKAGERASLTEQMYDGETTARKANSMTPDQELREAENQYHPWETEGITELEYYKRAYLETRKREEEATAKLRAYERAKGRIMKRIEESMKNPPKFALEWDFGWDEGLQKAKDIFLEELEAIQ